ncbi:hypothetical protein LCGC14_1538370 [marine sediment metagenome]|uniref:Uncharacterized protein n=1 Tax=marine sediment metagenome TaxID=412755 RepID=A0A0F9IU13_9ZZZZ
MQVQLRQLREQEMSFRMVDKRVTNSKGSNRYRNYLRSPKHAGNHGSIKKEVITKSDVEIIEDVMTIQKSNGTYLDKIESVNARRAMGRALQVQREQFRKSIYYMKNRIDISLYKRAVSEDLQQFVDWFNEEFNKLSKSIDKDRWKFR